MSNQLVICLLYGDDATLIGSTPSELQTQIIVINGYFMNMNKMELKYLKLN